MLCCEQSFAVVYLGNAFKEKSPEAGGACAELWVRNYGLLVHSKGRDGFEGYVCGPLVR